MVKGLLRLPASPALKLALSRINRSSIASGIQFGALSLSLMLIAIIWLVRSDLLVIGNKPYQKMCRMFLH